MKKMFSPLALTALCCGLSGLAMGADTPVTTAASPTQPRVIRVALNNVLIVAEQKGWIKEELDPLGGVAQLIACSPQTVPALFGRGGIDVANSMIGIAFMQLIGGFDPVIVWESKDINPRFITTVVLKDSPIKTLSDLKGKTLGAAQWSDPEYAAIDELQRVGLRLQTGEKPGDVKYLNTSEGGFSAIALLSSGKVDAYAGLATGITSLYLQEVVRDLSAADPNGWYVSGERVLFFARRDWIKDNADLTRGLLRAQERAVLWILDHPKAGAEIVATQLRQPENIIEAQFREPGNNRLHLPERDYPTALAALKRFQSAALANCEFPPNTQPLSDQKLENYYDKRFFRGGDYYLGDDNSSLGTASASNSSSPTPTSTQPEGITQK